MGQVKAWGMELCNQIENYFVQGFSLEVSIDKVVDDQMQQSPDLTRAWVKEQVQAVAYHPDMFGHDRHYWSNLRKAHRERRT